ncbi:MAG TPA: hypothetical protein VH413_14505 [Verrucomicrobiae bacterium]|jgi:hypothetical protein|nr:hypothetical protein [Verrucomicrobiae bacterium]
MKYRVHCVLLSLAFSFIALTSSWAQPLTVTTIAGQYGNSAYVNGTGTSASFLGYPDLLSADLSGNFYILEGDSVRKVGTNLSVSAFAGKPLTGGHSDLAGTNALFDLEPTTFGDIAVDTAGTVYVAESGGNYDVRKISNGIVTTVAGQFDNLGHMDGIGTAAEFFDPHAIAVDATGNLYVADGDNYPAGPRIRKITPAGVVTTFAGSGVFGTSDGHGTNAQFRYANGLAVDRSGTVYVADGWGIRLISPSGEVSTWVGNPNIFKEQDGLRTNAGFGGTSAMKIALDGTGGAYVTDGDTIRYVSSMGVVSTVAGLAGHFSTASDDGVGSSARFSNALGIGVDASRNVYVSDAGADIVLRCVPPALTPIGSFEYSTGGSPVQSSNPWHFTATYTNTVSDLRLRVQSTTNNASEGSWADLPGNSSMTDSDGVWTLNTTDIPTGTRYFRVVASAPGYFDSKSAGVGPETVTQGIEPFGQFTWETAVPFRYNSLWVFTIVEPSAIAGLNLRVQSSRTPDDIASWSDLPGGAQMTNHSWTLVTTNVPGGNISFRVVASAQNYFDHISSPIGPFNIAPPLPPINESSASGGGTYSLESVPDMMDSAEVTYDATVLDASIALVFSGNVQQFVATLTMAAQQYARAELTVGIGQIMTIPAINAGPNTTVLLKGAIDGDVAIGSSIVAQGGGNIVAQGGGNIVAQGGGNFASDDISMSQIVAQGGGNIVAQGGGNIVAQGGGNIVAQGGGNIVAQGGGNIEVNGGGNSANSETIYFPSDSTSAFAALVHPQRTKISVPSPLSPGAPAFTKQMVINGNYNQYAGTLFIGIAGPDTLVDGSQQYDQLAVSGTANLVGGTIAVGLFNPNDQTNQAGIFQPAVGATFDVLVASNILVDTIKLQGNIWGDGLFFSGQVVTRPDGLQAVRLTAVHVPPRLFLSNSGANSALIYATNYTGYAVQSSPSLLSPNWATFSTGTNAISISPTNSSQFFRLSKP